MRLRGHGYFPALTQRCHRKRVHLARSNLNIVSWHLLINSNGISVPRKWHTALLTDRFALSLKCHPISPVFFTSFPRPLSASADAGVSRSPWCRASPSLCSRGLNLHRLLVWLHLAFSFVLYIFCRNSKLGCVRCLSLCHRRSLLCEMKSNTSACNHLHGRQHFWQTTQVGVKKNSITQFREALRQYNKSLLLLIALLSRPN